MKLLKIKANIESKEPLRNFVLLASINYFLT